MGRVTAIFLSCVLLTASGLLASSVEETYQAALAQEKGGGNLEEAIRLYQQVIEAHEKGEGDEKMAARAQLRIGVCQEKLGLAQARQTYEAVRDKYPDQPQVEAEAEQRLKSAHRREATIERPSSLTASEIEIRSLLYPEEWSPLLVDADSAFIDKRRHRQLALIMEQLKQQMEQVKADSAFINEQTHRQLALIMKQLEQQMKQTAWELEQAERHIVEQAKRQKKLTERQLEALQRQLKRLQEQMLETIQRQGFRFERIRPPHLSPD